ncbi:MAG TPA: FecR domain-containing protein [Rhizomicrobium sp.]|nr:FecR domain-containing protein [Rhizomicrobium sp.]
MSEAESAEQIDEAAFAWVARLDREGRSPRTEAALEAWLAGDARRRGAFLRAEALWTRLDRASLAPAYAPPASVSRRVMLGAGSAVAASGVFAWLFFGRETSFDTTLGETRSVPLADGSEMVMNTQSRAAVSMTNAVRRVRLTAGEAWFDVEKNPSRPFVVEADRVRVQAVGTAFSVRRFDNGADVSVTEGAVEAWVEGAAEPHLRIEAGEKAFVSEAEPARARPARDTDIERKLAWRAGKIDLNGETLADAVAEFNRYNERKLKLASASLGRRRMYGLFRAHDPEGFARAVAVSLNATVQISADEISIAD